jgi:hypothetical protein
MIDDLPLFAAARQANQSTTPRAPARSIPGAAPELPAEVVTIFEHLRAAVGQQRGQTAAEIAEALGILPAHPRARRGDYVRRLINQHKLSAPFLIVADPANGFYRPADADELSHFHRSMRSRIREIALNLRATRLLAVRDGFIRTGSDTWATQASSQN